MQTSKKLPEFKGIFANLCLQFLAYKKSLGFKYDSETKALSRFSMFSDAYGVSELSLGKELVLAWTKKRPGEAVKSQQHRINMIRQFAIFLRSLGYDAYILPEQKWRSAKSFVPYVFTYKEIETIFKNADKIPALNVSPYIHKILPVLLRMLYSCGLRISEALQLKEADVDLEKGILTIKNTKFDKDRLIPMSDSLTEVCRNYRNTMNLLPTDYFFPARNKSQISPLTIYNRFRHLLWQSNISYRGLGNGPRLHDLRHTFAVHSLNKWVREGRDIYCMLPMLSTYLGHGNISSTGKYLRLTAEVYPEIVAATSKNCGYIIPSCAQYFQIADSEHSEVHGG